MPPWVSSKVRVLGFRAFHLGCVQRDAGLCPDMRGFNTGHGQCSGIGGGVVMQARAIRCGDADFQQVAARWRIICAVCRANHKRVFRVAARTTDPDLLPIGGGSQMLNALRG